MSELVIDMEQVKKTLVRFIAEQTHGAGFENLVLGLSGGVDSSTVAFLAAEAIGRKHVTALVMPYKTTPPECSADAETVIDLAGINALTVPITDQIDAYFEKVPEADRVRRGNKMSRERMSILYDQSAALNALVIGTSNKTEILLGYGTLHGDMACAFNPIGCLYKTQLRQLAAGIGVPERIVKKVPSADLWPGQTDETELGFSYESVDRLLFHVVDRGMSDDDLLKMGFDVEFMDRVRMLIRRSRYKRRLPPIARLPE